MKNSALALIAAASLCLTSLAHAQQPPSTSLDTVFYAKQDPDQYLAKDLLLSAKVKGDDGKIIGDIEDLIINEYNQVVGVIMGVGGFLGMGEKRIGVRYSALKFKEKDGKPEVTLPGVTRAVLKQTPAYKRALPPKSFFEKVIERSKELATKTSETTKDVYEKAKKNVGPALEKAKEKASEMYDKAKDGASATPK